MNKYSVNLISAIFLSIGMLFYGCNKETDEQQTESIKEKLATNLTSLRNAAVIFGEEYQKSQDTVAATMAMSEWLTKQPDVSDGWYHNFEFLEVEFSNGFKSPINIIPVDDSGEHLRRGGGADNSVAAFQFNNVQTKKIKNEKALVLIPYPTEFFYHESDINNLKNSIEAGNLGIEADIEVGKEVTLSDLDKLGNYGLIILDVHGLTYGFYLALLERSFEITDIWSPDDLIAEVFNVHSIPPDKIANGQIEIGLQIKTHKSGEVDFKFSVLITEEYIRQLNIDLSDAVVFGNHCYSGHTADGPNENNMPEAWRSKGAAAYFGYADLYGVSAPIDNDFCKDMEMALITNLISNGDTTGAAHLKPDGSENFYIPTYGYFRGKKVQLATLVPNNEPPSPRTVWPLYFQQFFDKDYEYENCGEDLVDDRDGQVYKTVCIGDQVWMAENLRWAGAGVCHNNDPAICDTYGRLYSLMEATGLNTSSANPSGIQGICPDSWHVPSVAEWDEFWNGVGQNPYKVKATTGWPLPNNNTNESGMSLLPGGRFSTDDSTSAFEEFGQAGYFWTTNETPDGHFYKAAIIGVGFSSDILVNPPSEVVRHYSCRCVKDK